jgi:hypothetical protein
VKIHVRALAYFDWRIFMALAFAMSLAAVERKVALPSAAYEGDGEGPVSKIMEMESR